MSRGLLLGLFSLLATNALPARAADLDAGRAAAQTAASNDANCTALAQFYWEIGDRDGEVLASGTRGLSPPSRSTSLRLYSAGKWLYAAYVLQKRGSAPLSLTDVQALTMHSGYTDQGQCLGMTTVAACQAALNGYDASAVGTFSYGPGHFQKHAVASMGLGTFGADQLASEIVGTLGGGFVLSYAPPHLAGGARSTAADYAVFLRRLLRGELALGALLGTHAVCADTGVDCGARSSPASDPLVGVQEPWHYALGHWVEDAPGIGDGAFSSTGLGGFYPWIDADRQYYGIFVRDVSTASSSGDSVKCGRQIRKAWQDALGPDNGICGVAQGSTTSLYPAAERCAVGTEQPLDQAGTDGSFNWSCKGYRGGASAVCSATSAAPVNGVCGSADGSETQTYPSTHLCSAGTVTTTDSVGADGSFNWSCFGSNGGSNASCTAQKITPIDGNCGTADGDAVAAYPTSGLCAAGTAQNTDTLAGDGQFDWTCAGIDGGADAACAAPKLVNGSCGTAANSSTNSYPASHLCAAGTVQSVDTAADDGSYNWSCAGAGGGTTASCVAPRIANGVCGSAAAVPNTAYPGAGHCASGIATASDTTASDGAFDWSCSGSNGGSAVSCAAPKTLDGACGPSANLGTASYPSSGLCASGTAAQIDGSGSDGTFDWSCSGLSGGASPSCSAPKQTPVAGQCGPASGSATLSYPSSNLCATGTPSAADVAGADGSFNWTCLGDFGGIGASCAAPNAATTNGACGAAANQTTAAAPGSGLCAAGPALMTDTVASDGAYNWQCQGVAGGTSTACAAPRQQAVVPTPTTEQDSSSSGGGAFGSGSVWSLLLLGLVALSRRRTWPA